jgi:hypothetical protein
VQRQSFCGKRSGVKTPYPPFPKKPPSEYPPLNFI